MSYGGDVDRGPFLNAINWTFHAIAFVVVFLRLLSVRVHDEKRWAVDDALIVLALCVNLARSIFLSVVISKGYGRHQAVLIEEDPIAAMELHRLLTILQAISLWTFTLPKLPVVALLIRLFNKFVVLLWLSAFALVALVIVLSTTTFVRCSPVESIWNVTITGKCWDPAIHLNIGYLAGAYSAFLDFAYALYPVIQVWKLQLPRERKVVIAVSLSLGFIACVVTIYKSVTLKVILEAHDATWASIPLEVWNSVEGTALIIAASAPLIRPVLLVFIRKLSSISRISYFTKSSYGGESAPERQGHDHRGKPSYPSADGHRFVPRGVHHDSLLESQDYPLGNEHVNKSRESSHTTHTPHEFLELSNFNDSRHS